jgi:hypothetical protein
MNQSMTISSETVADQLNAIEIRNYDLTIMEVVAVGGPLIDGFSSFSVGLAEDSSRLTMFASEAVLAREWNTPEEDEAWAHL